MKTKEEALNLLKSVSEAYDLTSVEEAAQHVITNYKQWDYQGSDMLFLAYCEEIVSEPAPAKH